MPNNPKALLGIRKQFDVDWDSLPELMRLMNLVKGRLGELRVLNNLQVSRKERFEALFSDCLEIWNGDISALYRNMQTDEERKYYVYVHQDGSRKIAINKHPITSFAATLGMTHFPFYIGKGTGDRCYDICRSETHRKMRQRMQGFGQEIIVHKVAEGLTESEAFQKEAKLIDIFGLITSAGTLTNLDEGCRPTERRALYQKAYENLRRINKGHVAA
jgi:hypothetical protein